MSTVRPEDEFIHQDYPRKGALPWKENWYFNFIDREHEAWGIFHISLERHKASGRFAAFHIVDGQTLLYVNTIPLTDDLTELTDGKLRVQFIEPLKRFRVTLDGPSHSVDLLYEARFDVFDYESGDGNGLRGNKQSMAMRHYEQALTVKGTLTKDGVSRPISCFGHRDHSWGYRDESNIAGWNWAAVQFEDKTINLAQVRISGLKDMNRGFVSEAEGNTGIRTVRILTTEEEPDGIPTSSTFEAVDEQGRVWTLTSQRFSGLVIPMAEKGKDVVVYENFADYTLAETGQRGLGIDEYLRNP